MTQVVDNAEGTSLRQEAPLAFEIVVFSLVASAALFLFVLRTGHSFGAGDLIDTDGYMRFLRVQSLVENGDWFHPISERSNYPYGEVLHWTRPLDAVIAAGALLLGPFLGDRALYAAAVAFGPLSLIALAIALRWGFGRFLAPAVRPLLLVGLLALPVVLGYAVPGRVDHHSLLFVLCLLTVALTLRILEGGHKAGVPLSLVLAVGLWVSPEFLVPVALVATTLGWSGVMQPATSPLTRVAMRTFLLAAGFGFLALLGERGSDWDTVDYARLSLVHPFILLMVGAAFVLYVRFARADWSRVRRLAFLAFSALTSALVVVGIFPGILGGPFVDFHPLVRERWLFRVTELQSVVQIGAEGILTHLAWALLALVVVALALWRRAGWTEGRWFRATYGWMVAYLVLSFYQLRWATFAQLLAVPLLAASLTPLYQRFQDNKLTLVVRPLLLASVIGLVVSVGPEVAAADDSAPGGGDCRLESVLPSLQALPSTTLLAEQDVGPEVMYRTEHTVVATPYGNEEAFLYTLDVMSEEDMGAVRDRLRERGIGLILVCPGRIDIMQPEQPAGTFYESLVAGEPPAFMDPVPLPAGTDYLLYTAET